MASSHSVVRRGPDRPSRVIQRCVARCAVVDPDHDDLVGDDCPGRPPL